MAEKKEIGEGLGISGMTLGVLSIVFTGLYGVLISIIGFIFCKIQQKKNKTKIGKVGLYLNAIGFILGIIFIILVIKYPNLIPAQ
ncbi:MAG: hypothetical protein AABX30_02930 [Nanoarchaeota archaeon]